MFIPIGEFTITSGRVIATDPGYEKDESQVLNCAKGIWKAEVSRNIVKDWGIRNFELRAFHSSCSRDRDWEETEIGVGVDSGQVGFFDVSKYPDGETGEYDESDNFYSTCCKLTLGPYYGDSMVANARLMMYEGIKEEHKGPNWSYDKKKVAEAKEVIRKHNAYPSAGLLDFGVISSSGFGDGGYPIYGIKKDDVYVALKAVFITTQDLPDWKEFMEALTGKKKDDK